MSFMFRPYPFVDPEAVNRILLPEEVLRSIRAGNEAVRGLLRSLAEPGKAIFFDGFVSADFSAFVKMCADAETACFDVSECWRDSAELDREFADILPEDREIDPVLLFGKKRDLPLAVFFDAEKIDAFRKKIEKAKASGKRVVVAGNGSLMKELRPLADVSVYLDVNALETTLRIRAGKVRNIGDAGKERKLSAIFRRMYYIDYEILMDHRQEVLSGGAVDWYADTNLADNPKILPLASFKTMLETQLASPFRCTPAYIEGVWGGFYVKKLRNLPEDMKNCAWVFDMIPNEVSLQIRAGRTTLNIPFTTFFKLYAEKLMGPESVRRFGLHFPIRFNYDDTYGGSGNMSVQVHPPKEYTKEHFGEDIQQDESYYCVKTAGSCTYLGLTDDCGKDEFFAMIDRAEKEHIPFDYRKYVNSFPSEEGDQYLIPGGTLHASGRNQVVLEIGSTTIGSYTFKLYDYLRADLDGNPRPIHSIHGKNVLCTDRRRSAIDGVLRPSPKLVRQGPGWKEEIVGEHDLIYFSLRRFTFENCVSDDTDGKFHVLVLVKGEEVLVYSKKNPECRYHQKYMDMIVVPASLGEYGILNLGKTPCVMTKTMLK